MQNGSIGLGRLSLEIAGNTFVFDEGRVSIIGRSPEVMVPVLSDTVSRHHLEVYFGEGGWQARDLNTMNGTFVNGSRIPSGSSVRLVDGLKLMLGDPTDGVPVSVRGAGVATPIVAPPSRDPDPTAGLTVSVDQLKLVRFDSETRGPYETSSQGFAPQAAVVTIGRDLDNSLVIHDPMVSGHHARLTAIGPGRYRVEDLRSTNGTFVNGARITSADVGSGDVLNIEKLFLRVTPAGLQRLGQSGAATPFVAGAGTSGTSSGQNISLAVSGVTFSVPTSRAEQDRGFGRTKNLLDGVTFNVPERSLLAVIGPSGAGKSTMLKTMTGTLRPVQGKVLFKGLDMAVFSDSLSHQIGVVPQDDLVHVDLTARHALEYAARLRFPDDATREERHDAVEWALRELGLATHADTRIKQMSGGQRKRVSTAMELLTRPEALFLDEPTSGLDPNLDREVMELLQKLAHGTEQNSVGRTVVVITHSTTNLDRADNVLLLAPGGKVAYFGPPDRLKGYFASQLPDGDVSYASIYELLSRDPDRAKAVFAKSELAPATASTGTDQVRAHPQTSKTKPHLLPQALTLLSRQARLTLADTSLLIFMVALPIVMGLLTLAVRSKNGFSSAATTKSISDPKVLLIVLVFGAVLMGMVPSVRQLVGERAIFQREAGAGVRPSAYLASKLLILGFVNLLQSILLVAVVLAVNHHPDRGLIWPLAVELTIVAFAVSWTCGALGLLLSGLVSTSEQVMPLMVVALMLQLVLSGGVIPVTAGGVNQASWFVPSRWGFAAGASSLDLNKNILCRLQELTKAQADDEVNKRAREATDKANQAAADQAKAGGLPAPTPKTPDVVHTQVDCATVDDLDPLWSADVKTWAEDLGALALSFGLYGAATYFALRRVARR